MLPANSCIPRCQRRAPELRVVIGPISAGSMRPRASRRQPRFGRLSRPCPGAVHARRDPDGIRPLAPVSLADATGGEASLVFQPMPLPRPPRERRPFPRHRTPSASEQPSSGPLDPTGCCHPAGSARRPFAPGCRFSRAYRLGLGPRGPHQPQPAKLVWTRRRLLTSANLRECPGTPGERQFLTRSAASGAWPSPTPRGREP